MILLDTNLLLYSIDRSNQRHAAAKEWVEQQFSGIDLVGLAWTVLLGFIRMSTNPRIVRFPLSLDGAMKRAEMWLKCAPSRLIHESPHHWLLRKRMLQAAPTTGGSLTMDAHLAALAIEHQPEVCTADADFSRFPDVRWRNPLL